MIDALRRHPLLVTTLVLSVLLALFFAARFTVRAAYFAQHREEPVAGWMTVGYVGRSWGVDAREINRIAGLSLPEGRPTTLEEIAKAQGVPLSEIVARVEAALAILAAEHKPEMGAPP